MERKELVDYVVGHPYISIADFISEIDNNYEYISVGKVMIKSVDDKTDIIQIIVPGYSKDDIKVGIVDNILTVKGKISESESMICDNDNIDKHFKLRKKYDYDKIEAVVKHGILTIKLPMEESDYYNIDIK